MNVHVLSGDSLVHDFEKTEIEGEMIVCRECLVDGDLEAESLDDFWNVRESYLGQNSTKSDGFYAEKVKNEFIKLWNLADGNTVNLWFEYELFCQVNLWFSLWLIRNTEAEFYVVYPKLKNNEDVWKGFAYLDENELKESFGERIKFGHDEVYLGVQLWEAFQKRDFEKLAELGQTDSKCFPTLKEVCEAAIAIDSRPKESIRKIIAKGNEEFGPVFQEFNETEAVYGFGDLQVKKIYDEVMGE